MATHTHKKNPSGGPTRCRMSNVAPNKVFSARIGVILVIKLRIMCLLVKLSHSPFTHSLLIFLGN